MVEEGDPASADAEAVERGRLLFARECRFVAGAATEGALPQFELPEIAFAGRSNVGKSSLINALTGRNTIARTSNTPGRTQQINFFLLDARLMLVDLPGYGYAKAPKGRVRAWTGLIENYLRGRVNLRRVCLLIDARHGFKEVDETAMKLMDAAAVSYQVVLTKCDKAGGGLLEETSELVAEALARHTAAHPVVIATSALRGAGLAELRAALSALADDASLR